MRLKSEEENWEFKKQLEHRKENCDGKLKQLKIKIK